MTPILSPEFVLNNVLKSWALIVLMTTYGYVIASVLPLMTTYGLFWLGMEPDSKTGMGDPAAVLLRHSASCLESRKSPVDQNLPGFFVTNVRGLATNLKTVWPRLSILSESRHRALIKKLPPCWDTGATPPSVRHQRWVLGGYEYRQQGHGMLVGL